MEGGELPNVYKPKLVHLPGTVLSPELVLRRTLEKISYIRSVAVVIEWKEDRSVDVDWSQMSLRDLSFLAESLRFRAHGVMRDLEEE